MAPGRRPPSLVLGFILFQARWPGVAARNGCHSRRQCKPGASDRSGLEFRVIVKVGCCGCGPGFGPAAALGRSPNSHSPEYGPTVPWPVTGFIHSVPVLQNADWSSPPASATPHGGPLPLSPPLFAVSESLGPGNSLGDGPGTRYRTPLAWLWLGPAGPRWPAGAVAQRTRSRGNGG